MANKLLMQAAAELKYLEELRRKLGEPVMPEDYGRIEIMAKEGRFYYEKANPYGKTYISKNSKECLMENMQYAYDKKVKNVLDKKVNALKRFVNSYDGKDIREIYENLHPGRKPYVTPIVETDEDYIERWMNKKSIPNTYEFKSEIYSNRGEQVRSKSEKIIADWLYAHNIPYRYEKDLKLRNGEIVYPDFTILCLKNRREIYWEHLGRMDDSDYAEKNVRKVEKYERSKIIPGKNLILTFETSETVLDARLIPELLKPYME